MSKFKLYPEYKDSGIDWLGKVPEHWKIGRLKHLATIRNGRDHALVEAECGPYPVIGSGGQFSRATSYLYDGVSVLFGRKGTVDKPLYVKGRFWTVDTMFYSEINHSIADDKYLFYCALTIPFDYYATNTALPSMTQRELSNHAMNIPPKKEQAQVALFLDHETARMDELIAEQKRLIELLKEKRQTVISHAVTKGLDPNAPMKDSGIEWLGEVPEHWDIKKQKRLVRLVTRKIKTGQFYVALENIESWTGCFIEAENIYEGEGVSFDKGDILFGKLRPYLAKAWLADRAGIAVGDFFIIRTDLNEIDPEYLQKYLLTPSCLDFLNSTTIGAKMPRISWNVFSVLRVPVPPLGEQEAIVSILNAEITKIDSLIKEAEKAIDLMKERRSALISAAVTGKIDVRDWQPEKEVAEALAS